MHYDCTVRNAAGSIVQLSYGDDGLDPVLMEGKGGAPLDFDRLLAKVCVGVCLCVLTLQVQRQDMCVSVCVGEGGGAEGANSIGGGVRMCTCEGCNGSRAWQGLPVQTGLLNVF